MSLILDVDKKSLKFQFVYWNILDLSIEFYGNIDLELSLSGKCTASRDSVEIENLGTLFFDTNGLDFTCSSFNSTNFDAVLILKINQESLNRLQQTKDVSFASILPIVNDRICKNILDYQSEQISASLLNYQLYSVKWMLSCEGKEMLNGQLVNINARSPPGKIKVSDDTMLDLFSSEITPSFNIDAKGGVLSDEMGLGKTVMILSLISLNPMIECDNDSPELIHSPATLIICPATILFQWIQEIDTHAPNLKYRRFQLMLDSDVDELAKYDVILVSIEELRKDYYLETPDKLLRYEKIYEKRKSLLTRIKFWRLIIDEAQMAGPFSHSAEVASRIKSFNRWCVTGTPASKSGSLEEIISMFSFTGIHMRNIIDKVRLYPNDVAKSILAPFIRANTKKNVQNELVIPRQTETRVLLDFEKVEQLYYDDLWKESQSKLQEMYNHIKNLNEEFEDADPTPRSYEETRKKKRTLGKLRENLAADLKSWLLRLRQTCCHPQISAANQRVLGGIPRSISAVLDTMMNQCLSNISNTERHLILKRIERAQVDEFQSRFQDALKIYFAELPVVWQRISLLQKELPHEKESLLEEEFDEEEQLTTVSNRLRLWREVEHQLLFFIASDYHSLARKEREKYNEKQADKYQKLEDKYYKDAADLRALILAEYEKQVVESAEIGQEVFVKVARELEALPNLVADNIQGGIVTHLVFEDISEVFEVIEEQLYTLKDWRNKIILSICGPLEDSQAQQATGDEYNEGLENQEIGMIYQNAYNHLINAFKYSLSGIRAPIDKNMNQSEEEKKLMDAVTKLQTKRNLKTLFNTINNLKSSRNMGDEELRLLSHLLPNLKRKFKKLETVLPMLENEISSFRKIFNNRVKYYIQLNKLSDSVEAIDLESVNLEELMSNNAKSTESLNLKIAQLYGRKRYLEHLKKEQKDENECLICKSDISEGLVTNCGHLFCVICSSGWFLKKKHCPACNQVVEPGDLVRIYSLQTNLTNAIESASSSELLDKIKQIRISGSFGTKIDMIIRHIIELQSQDPYVKCLIFSQWQQMLDIIATALETNSIGYIRHEGTGWTTEGKLRAKKGQAPISFRANPNICAFMLHAKNQSSGLTLVCATHVFLVEPVLNAGLEKQAVNRIHRIGQTKETFVWKYLIRNTIEESISCNSTLSCTNTILDKGGEVVTMDESLSLFDIK